MKSRDFVYWLQGFFELGGGNVKSLNSEQVELIRKHLSLVFIHEIDPEAGDEDHQKLLNEVHGVDLKNIKLCCKNYKQCLKCFKCKNCSCSCEPLTEIINDNEPIYSQQAEKEIVITVEYDEFQKDPEKWMKMVDANTRVNVMKDGKVSSSYSTSKPISTFHEEDYVSSKNEGVVFRC